MRSVTSYFNGAVFKKTLTRFWPIWAANLVLWVLVFPLNLLMQVQRGHDVSYFTDGLMYDTSFLLVAGSLVLSAMTAMAVCSHLYQTRSANFFGALPVRREGVFLSVYLAGLCMMLAPNLLTFALMVPVELMGNALEMIPLLVWLAATCVMEFFFFSFAVFCGMFTGHILALPVFFGVFNVLAVSAYSLGQFVMREFYYGYAVTGGELLEKSVEWLTPAYQFTKVNCFWKDGGFVVQGGGVLVAYAVAGLAFAVVALLLYRRRQMESAGDVVAVRAMRPVFRYGVAICVGVFFGFATKAILNLGELGLMVSIVIWAVVGGFVAQMLLDKTFKVFRKWKGCAAVALVLIAVFAVIGLDLTGYETRIPQSGEVIRAEVTGLNCRPYDSASYWDHVTVDDAQMLETVIQLHRLAVENREGRATPERNYWDFQVVYTLQGGKKLARQYMLYDGAGSAAGQVTALIQTLNDDPALTRARYGLDELQKMLDEGGRLECDVDVDIRGKAQPQTTTDVQGNSYSGSGAQTLWQAVLRDLNEGTIGRHDAKLYKRDAQQDMVCVLCFHARTPQRTQLTLSGTAVVEAAAEVRERYVEIAVPETARHTLAALEELESRE